MNIEDLSPELIEKARACTSAEELLKLAESEGVELTDEQLDGISGGYDWQQGPPECDWDMW